MVFQIGIGIAIAISTSDEDRDRDRDLDFGDRGHALGKSVIHVEHHYKIILKTYFLINIIYKSGYNSFPQSLAHFVPLFLFTFLISDSLPQF